MELRLDGWDIRSAASEEWIPWGGEGNAKAKVLGAADGYTVVYVEADAGYAGTPHEHSHAEFFYLIEGSLRNQGRHMVAGDGYAAAAGSVHEDFVTETGAKYIVIFNV